MGNCCNNNHSNRITGDNKEGLMLELNHLYNLDCMEGMAQFPDNYFDLAIVDPEFGIGPVWNKSKKAQFYNHKSNHTNTKKVDSNYIAELQRISNDQIIWGWNYICHLLPETNNIIIWDKDRNVEKTFMSEVELAWSSFNVPAYIIKVVWDGGRKDKETGIKTIHPFQKPIDLYKKVLNNHAAPHFKIIDTHAGSCSSVIAFLDYGCQWVAFEIDKDYYEAASKRIEIHKAQLKLF